MKVWTYVQTIGKQDLLSHILRKKQIWTTIFKVGRSDIDVHTYESMQNPEYSDGRDRFPVVWKGFLYILSQP